MPTRDELIAERDRARDAVLAAASELTDANDGIIRVGNRDELAAQESQVFACAEVLADRVALWRAADDAVESQP